MTDFDHIARLRNLQRDAEIASKIRQNTLDGKLQQCPKCHKVSLFWNTYGNNGEGCFECLACEMVYFTERSLITAECNARNEERFNSYSSLWPL